MNSEPTKLDRRKEIRELEAENASLRAEVERLETENARLLAANRDCIDHFDACREDLAASQLEAKRLRDTMQKIAGHPEETPPFYWWQIYARNALSSPASTEALDAYVAEKVKSARVIDEKQIAYLLEERSVFTRQRDLAVSALKTCLPVYKSGLKGYYPDDQKIHEALAAIKESEA